MLWVQCVQPVASMLAEETAALSGAQRTDRSTTVTAATRTTDNRSLDVVALSAQEAAGVEIRAELVPFGVSLDAFPYLARPRTLLAGVTLTEDEWQDIASILVQSRQSGCAGSGGWTSSGCTSYSRPTASWSAPTSAAPGPEDPKRWRRPGGPAGVAAYGPVRAKQAADLDALADQGSTRWGAVRCPPCATRCWPSWAAGKPTAEPPPRTAERLSRQLCIDLQAAADARTSRVTQRSTRCRHCSSAPGRGITRAAGTNSWPPAWSGSTWSSTWPSPRHPVAGGDHRLRVAAEPTCGRTRSSAR